jgi:hypothetical protein
MVGWALFSQDNVRVTGSPTLYRSSEHVTLFYTNSSAFPGMIDVQTATLDDQSVYPPAIHVQWAEAAPWMGQAHDLPKFDRFPEG